MDTSERQRLEKLLGMLGSTFDGERANAARMIASMAERKNVTIAELVLGAPPPDYSPPRKKRAGSATVIIRALVDIAASEIELEFTLTTWEYQFAVDVSSKNEFDYELSEKQLKAAERIIDKVEKARERARSA